MRAWRVLLSISTAKADRPDDPVNNLQRSVGLDHVGLLDLLSVLVDKAVRERRTNRRLGELRSRLATIDDAAGNWRQARGGIVLARRASRQDGQGDHCNRSQFHRALISQLRLTVAYMVAARNRQALKAYTECFLMAGARRHRDPLVRVSLHVVGG